LTTWRERAARIWLTWVNYLATRIEVASRWPTTTRKNEVTPTTRIEDTISATRASTTFRGDLLTPYLVLIRSLRRRLRYLSSDVLTPLAFESSPKVPQEIALSVGTCGTQKRTDKHSKKHSIVHSKSLYPFV
jgi:hypothetical protein